MSDEKRLPFMRFYWGDWRADPGLRLCSLAARGLWADMLSIMHEAEPYGFLIISGRPATPNDLARIAGASLKEINLCLKELSTHAVFSVNSDGTPFSRRMVRDKERSEKAREWGKAGGNPNIKKTKRLEQDADKIEDEKTIMSGLTPTQGLALSSTLKPHIPESRSHIPDSYISPSGLIEKKHEPGELLDRLARALAIDHKSLHRHPKLARFPELYHEWLQYGCDPESEIWPTIEKLAKRSGAISSPWFFDSAIRKARDSRISPLVAEVTPDRWRQRLRGFRDRENWDDAEWGARPGEIGCRVPADLLAEFNFVTHERHTA